MKRHDKTPADVAEKEKSKKLNYTNLDKLNQLTKSKPKLMLEMISVYLEQTPTLVTAMKESLKDKDWDLLQAAAHKMITSFSIVGIDVKYENISKKIQEYAKAEIHLDELPALVAQLDTVCTHACTELDEEFSAIKSGAES